MVNHSVTGTVGVQGKDRPRIVDPAEARHAIGFTLAANGDTRLRIFSVIRDRPKVMQDRIAGAIPVHLENRPDTVAAARVAGAVKNARAFGQSSHRSAAISGRAAEVMQHHITGALPLHAINHTVAIRAAEHRRAVKLSVAPLDHARRGRLPHPFTKSKRA